MTVRDLLMGAAQNIDLTEITTILPGDILAGDRFGFRTCISPDGNKLAISAYNKDVGTVVDAGVVYIFTRSGSSWVQQAKLNISSPETNDRLGYSLAFDASGTSLVVGAPYDQTATYSDNGTVHLYKQDTNALTWTLSQVFVASDRLNSDLFGFSVAISALGTTVVVGAPSDDNSLGTNAGSVYVFRQTSPTAWSSTRLQGTTSADIQLGISVAVNADGDSIISGASVGTSPNYYSSVHHFQYDGASTWTPTRFSTNITLDGFGDSVCISADGRTMVVGIPNNDKVYVYTRTSGSTTTWSAPTVIQRSGAYKFGFSVAITADGKTLAVGTPYENSNRGTVYIYKYILGSWIYTSNISAKYVSAIGNVQVGESVSLSAEGNTLLASSSYADIDSSNINSGEAYVFTGYTGTDSANWINGLEIPVVPAYTSQTSETIDMRKTMDVSADGSTMVQLNTTDSANYAVDVYKKIGTSWTYNTTIRSVAANDLFGTSIAINGNGTRFVVGSRGTVSNRGGIVVYTYTSGTSWSENKIGHPNSLAFGDQFGWAVDINSAGTRIAVGAPNNDNVNGTNMGAVYILEESTGWGVSATLITGNVIPQIFGKVLSFSPDGNLLAVGCDRGYTQGGSVFVYGYTAGTGWTEKKYTIFGAGTTGFGSSVAITDSGILAVGAHTYSTTPSPTPYTYSEGGVYIFPDYMNSSSYTILRPSPLQTSAYFGKNISLTSDGNVIAITAEAMNTNLSTYGGTIFVFRNVSGSWQLASKITDSYSVKDFSAFGTGPVVITDDQTIFTRTFDSSYINNNYTVSKKTVIRYKTKA